MLGVGDGYFNRLSNGGPIEGDEKESLLRILFRLRMFPALDVDRWALDPERLAEAIERPDEFRGSIFRLRGRVIEVEPCKPPAEAAGRYELTKYFRCRLQLDSPGETAEVYAENVPAAWQKGAEPDAPGGAFGVFLKLGRRSAGRTTLIFAARRLAWYPDDLLGRLGMDVGLLDDVKDQEPLHRARQRSLLPNVRRRGTGRTGPTAPPGRGRSAPTSRASGGGPTRTVKSATA